MIKYLISINIYLSCIYLEIAVLRGIVDLVVQPVVYAAQYCLRLPYLEVPLHRVLGGQPPGAVGLLVANVADDVLNKVVQLKYKFLSLQLLNLH